MDPVKNSASDVDDTETVKDTNSHSQDREVEIENALDLHSQYVKNPSGYTVYTRRWFILSTIAVVNFVNALVSLKAFGFRKDQLKHVLVWVESGGRLSKSPYITVPYCIGCPVMQFANRIRHSQSINI